MSNNLTSSVTLDLQLQIEKDDKSKDAIRTLEKKLKGIGDIAKKSVNNALDMSGNLNDAENAIDDMMRHFKETMNDTSLDLDAVVKSYLRGSKKVIDALDAQYAYLKEKQSNTGNKLAELQAEYEKAQKWHEDQLDRGLYGIGSNQETEELKKAIQEAQEKKKIEDELIALNIRKNKELRVQLKSEQIYAKLEKERLKLLQQATKEQIANGEALKLATKQAEQMVSKWENIKKGIAAVNKALQTASNAVNVVRGVNEYKDRALNKARTAVQGGIGMARGIASGVSMVTGAADNEVERERQAGRVKGYSREDAQGLLSELYVNTGADYAAIVEAINRVQNTLGRGMQRGEFTQAVEMELRYPGLSTAFASQTGTKGSGAIGYRQYASKLNAIQQLTGASDEQIAASVQSFANRKELKFSSGSISDYQAVYLAMQNSGAFESEEELEDVFKKFVQKQSSSGKSVFEFAKGFKMADYVRGERNKLQAQTADKNIDWGTFEKDLRANEGMEHIPSDAEQTARKMRELEEQKNRLLIKLMPSAMKIVEALVEVLSGDEAKKLVEGLVEFFNGVAPLLKPIAVMLTTVLKWFNETIMPWVQDIINGSVNALMDFGTSIRDKFKGSTPQKANGGIVWGTSIVGERGPEAIIPLDYSRAQRAENIAYSIQNNFSMSGNETTALSLAQAVSSRDFSRAMGKAAFKAGRLGAF